MDTTSVTYPGPTPQVEALEREISRLQHRRPDLLGRIQRAEHIIVTQLSCRKSVRPIRVHVHADGTRSFTIASCSKLSLVYRVSSDFVCDCPDTRRRSHGVKPPACKHSISCYLLARVLGLLPPVVKTTACFGCGEQTPNPQLTEVQDYHESLTYFAGDLLCPECFSGSDCW